MATSGGYGFGQYGSGGYGQFVVGRALYGPAVAGLGQNAQFNLVDTYEDGSQVVVVDGVTWASSSTANAVVSSSGRVSCVAPGTVTISAQTADGVSYSSSLMINLGSPVSITVSGSLDHMAVGAQAQLVAVAIYADATVADVSRLATWTTNSSSLAVSSTGMVTAIRLTNPALKGRPSAQFVPAVTATLAGISGSFSIGITSAQEVPVVPPAGTYRSHRTQTLLNYFDSSDQRVREEPYTLDAQLLNTAAMALDDSQLRIGREIASRTLARCPTGIDNRGLYYQVALPKDIPLAPGQTALSQVTGIRNGTTVTIHPYDDRLPVPSGYSIDSGQPAVALTSPVLFDVTGTGDGSRGVWNPVTLGPYTLAVPNVLSFYVENIGGVPMALDIFVEGHEYPLPVWKDQQTGASETVTRSNEGFFTSIRVWQDVTSIVIRGLPAGVRLRCWQLPFNLPAVPDPARPYIHPVFRGTRFDRYWQVSPSSNLLEELFMMDNYSTLEYVQSYQMGSSLSDLAIEPYTWGTVAASGTNLIYWDRREPFPDQLNATASVSEPVYGVDVRYDITKPGSTRYVKIRPVDYGSAALATRWRYVLMAPDGTCQVILPDGSLSSYSGSAGWQVGTPVKVSVPLNTTGTWVITLECVDGGGQVSRDAFPYPNLAVPSSHSYDLSAIVSNIQGVAYDAMGRLWVWTGSQAVAIKPRYDAYILDPAGKFLYLTDSYTSVSFQ